MTPSRRPLGRDLPGALRPALALAGLLLLATLPATGQEVTPRGDVGPDANVQRAPTLVFLVRHAEKTDDSGDPPLSAAGVRRAGALARLLGEAGLTHVHTTDYRRARTTAGPVAEAAGLAPRIYAADDLEGLARTVREKPGRHLVVGHSNTTPEVVRLLGGSPGPPIDEASEYDRLYVLILGPDGGATTTVLRYGGP